MREQGREGEGEQSGAKPSVLHIVRPAAGGMVTHLRLLLPRLQTAGIEVALLAPPSLNPADLDGARSSTPSETPFSLFSAPIHARPHPIHDLRAARRAVSLSCSGSGFELLHGHGLRGAWIAALASRPARRPFLFTAHNLAPSDPGLLSRFALRFVLRRAAAVISVSDAVQNGFARFGLRSGTAEVIPNGIDLTTFDAVAASTRVRGELSVSDEDLLVAAVGRLSPEKGFDTLIRAAAIVLRAEGDLADRVRFLLAGDGPRESKLAALVSELEIGERFRLLGRYPHVPALLSASDVVVVPSLEEGQGLVALEAMAASRPVLASRVGGLPEVVIDGVTGRLLAAGDPADLASALEGLLTAPETRHRLGAEGRTRVERLYTADVMAQRTVQVYRGIRRTP